MKKAIFITIPETESDSVNGFIETMTDLEGDNFARSGDNLIYLVAEEDSEYFIEESRRTAIQYNIGITIFDGIPDTENYTNVI